MKYFPTNVRCSSRDDARGYGYIVTLPNGTEEWHRLAWQATARAHGWIPPSAVKDTGEHLAANGKPIDGYPRQQA